MDMSKDYNNFDYLSVSVKSDQLSRILQCYRVLGWTEVKTEDDKRYYDMSYVRLRRPHKIPNKDRLQYLQVRMESAINSLVEIVGRAHVKSTAVISVLVIIFLVCTGLAAWQFLSLNQTYSQVYGWICAGVACASALAACIAGACMRRRERRAAADKISARLKLMQSLIAEAKLLVPQPQNEDEERAGEVNNG